MIYGALAGGVLVLRWHGRGLHVPSFLWRATMESGGGIYPRNPLEFQMRALVGGTLYDVRFVEHYLLRSSTPTA